MILGKCHHRILLTPKRFQTASTSAPKIEQKPKEIKIPLRIKRGPTDILKALASTVKEDVTGFHHKFHDDPWLLPTTYAQKQNNALSKEAGRQAARYLVHKFPTLFMYDQDEPRLDAWRPKARPLNEDAENVDEALLLDRIEKRWISNCIEIYERLKNENKSLSNETQLKLLEILSYYNCDEPIETDWAEKTFYRSLLNSPEPMSKWKPDGTAMILFEEMENKDARAYSAVICGMAKFQEPKLCLSMYEKMIEEKLKPDLNVYYALLQCPKEEIDEHWSWIENIFKLMRDNEIRPTVKMFNLAMLSMFRHPKKSDKTKDRCMQVFREMLALKIKPSLTSYWCVLNCHENESNFGSCVDAVLKMVENKKHEIIMDEDNLFFPYTMSVIADRLQNVSFAYRLHRDVLKFGDNYKFLNDAEAETFYYDKLFGLLSFMEEKEKFFQAYDSLVPNVYSPSIDVISRIISNFEITNCVNFIPKIYSSIIHLGYGYNKRCLMEFLDIMMRAKDVDLETCRLFAETAYQMKETVDLQFDLFENPSTTKLKDSSKKKFRRPALAWTDRMVTSLAILSARGGQYKRSYEIFQKLIPPSKNEDVIQAAMDKGTFPPSTPKDQHLQEYVRLLVNGNQLEMCYSVLKYMADIGYSRQVKDWVSVIVEKPGLQSLEVKLFKTLMSVKRQPKVKMLPRKIVPAVRTVPDEAAIEDDLNNEKS